MYEACERFEKLGVKFVKKPDGGSMKGCALALTCCLLNIGLPVHVLQASPACRLAFIQDPDGYWIEVLNALAGRAFA